MHKSEYNNNSVFELHDLIMSKFDQELAITQVVNVVLSAVKTVESRLDTVDLRSNLTVAQRYWNNDASESELYSARITAWESINGRSVNFTDPEVSLVRLLLCVLYGKKETDTPQDGWLYLILDFALNAEIEVDVLLNILRKEFAEVLNESVC